MKMKMAALGLILAGLAMAPLAGAQPQPAPAAVQKIAVINLVEAFSRLNAMKNGNQELDNMTNALQKQLKTMEADLDDMRKQLTTTGSDGVDPHSAMGKDLMDKAMKKAEDLQAFQGYIREKLSMEQRVRTAAVYRSINDAVKTYAQAHGISLVLMIDSMNLEQAASPDELISRITVRKVIYADDSMNITTAIVEQMNAATHLEGSGGKP